MTGRDLIIYILENNLENEILFKDGKIPGLITIEEAALKFNVGFETVKLWFNLDILPGVEIGDSIYILANATKGAV